MGGTVQKQKFRGLNKIIVLLDPSSGFSGFLERRLDFSTACGFRGLNFEEFHLFYFLLD